MKLSQLNLKYISNLTGRQFEFYIADLIHLIGGYKTKVTPAQNDRGIDVIFNDTDILPHKQVQVGVQVKLNNTGSVGYSAEEETVAGIKYYKLGEGIVVTNGRFSYEAQQSAHRLHLTLWDKTALRSLLSNAREKLTIDKLSDIGLSHKSLLDMKYLSNKMGFNNYQLLMYHMISEYISNHSGMNKNDIKAKKPSRVVDNKPKHPQVSNVSIPSSFVKYGNVYKSARITLLQLARLNAIQNIKGIPSRSKTIKMLLDNYIASNYNDSEQKIMRTFEKGFINQHK